MTRWVSTISFLLAAATCAWGAEPPPFYPSALDTSTGLPIQSATSMV